MKTGPISLSPLHQHSPLTYCRHLMRTPFPALTGRVSTPKMTPTVLEYAAAQVEPTAVLDLRESNTWQDNVRSFLDWVKAWRMMHPECELSSFAIMGELFVVWATRRGCKMSHLKCVECVDKPVPPDTTRPHRRYCLLRLLAGRSANIVVATHGALWSSSLLSSPVCRGRSASHPHSQRVSKESFTYLQMKVSVVSLSESLRCFSSFCESTTSRSICPWLSIQKCSSAW